jgi:hypothetical protein
MQEKTESIKVCRVEGRPTSLFSILLPLSGMSEENKEQDRSYESFILPLTVHG